MAPSNLWGSSDASSSIYSNDEGQAPDVKPLIARKDSASANSTTSSASKSSTVYSEESIKSMGYRPFEYWKGPKPAARPGASSSSKRRALSPLAPPLPPPPRLTGTTNPMKPINALQDFKPLPRAKVVEVQTYMRDTAPPSPRVKDRYAARMAERARRKRERLQRIEAWPGWVPDEKVLGLQQQQAQAQAQLAALKEDGLAQSERRTSSLASRERWTSPSTWRRRVWGVVVSVGVLALIAVIIVSTTITQDNAPSLNRPRYVRWDNRRAETLEAPDLSAPPSSASSLRSLTSVSSSTPHRIARRFRERNILTGS